jgi:hypothetical protein
MFRTLFAAFLILSALPVAAQAQRKPVISAAVPSPDDRARAWLVLVDDKNYAQSWNDAGKAFQRRQKADAWVASEVASREPMGAVASRNLKSIDLSRNNIAIVRYDTVFAHKAAAVETVTLGFENGAWSVTNYAIN